MKHFNYDKNVHTSFLKAKKKNKNKITSGCFQWVNDTKKFKNHPLYYYDYKIYIKHVSYAVYLLKKYNLILS